MKQLINKFKSLDKTKKLVILFVTISFVFIVSIGVYQSFNNSSDNNSTVVVNEQKEDKKTAKNSKQDTNDNTTANNQENDSQEQQETTTTTEDKKQDNSSKKENKTSKNKSKTSSNKKESNTNNNTTTKESNTQNNQTTTEQNKTEESQETTQDKIQVTLTVRGMGNIMMSGQLQLEKNTSVYSALKTLANQKGLKVSGSSTYVTGIGDLYEKQHGSGSGWMYQVNGTIPNKPAGYYYLSDGDTVLWYYVNYE